MDRIFYIRIDASAWENKHGITILVSKVEGEENVWRAGWSVCRGEQFSKQAGRNEAYNSPSYRFNSGGWNVLQDLLVSFTHSSATAVKYLDDIQYSDFTDGFTPWGYSRIEKVFRHIRAKMLRQEKWSANPMLYWEDVIASDVAAAAQPETPPTIEASLGDGWHRTDIEPPEEGDADRQFIYYEPLAKYVGILSGNFIRRNPNVAGFWREIPVLPVVA